MNDTIIMALTLGLGILLGFMLGAGFLFFFGQSNQEDPAYTASLESALAECRDALPTPGPGHKLEGEWARAMSDPESVSEYVKKWSLELLSGREVHTLRKGVVGMKVIHLPSDDTEGGAI